MRKKGCFSLTKGSVQYITRFIHFSVWRIRYLTSYFQTPLSTSHHFLWDKRMLVWTNFRCDAFLWWKNHSTRMGNKQTTFTDEQFEAYQVRSCRLFLSVIRLYRDVHLLGASPGIIKIYIGFRVYRETNQYHLLKAWGHVFFNSLSLVDCVDYSILSDKYRPII